MVSIILHRERDGAAGVVQAHTTVGPADVSSEKVNTCRHGCCLLSHSIQSLDVVVMCRGVAVYLLVEVWRCDSGSDLRSSATKDESSEDGWTDGLDADPVQ